MPRSNVCTQIVSNPKEILKDCSTQEMAAAVIGIMRVMPEHGYQLIAEEAIEHDIFYELLSAMMDNAQ